MTTEPKPSVARRLFALSRNICYYERCEEKLASPEWPRLNCDIAHIAGESLGSARYDSGMTDDERRDFANLMLLCPNHHRRIDAVQVEAHPVERLTAMKAKHEEHAADTRWWSTEDELDNYVDLAVEAARRASPADVRVARPELVLRQDDQTLVAHNRGDADAVRISMEPIGGSDDEQGLVRIDDPPERISPGGEWQAGLHIRTFGDAGPDGVRIVYHSDDGARFVGDFPL